MPLPLDQLCRQGRNFTFHAPYPHCTSQESCQPSCPFSSNYGYYCYYYYSSSSQGCGGYPTCWMKHPPHSAWVTWVKCCWTFPNSTCRGPSGSLRQRHLHIAGHLVSSPKLPGNQNGARNRRSLTNGNGSEPPKMWCDVAYISLPLKWLDKHTSHPSSSLLVSNVETMVLLFDPRAMSNSAAVFSLQASKWS